MVMCKSSPTNSAQPSDQKDSLSTQKTYYTSQFDSLDMIVPFMKNKVMIDSLMNEITNQKSIKLISELRTSENSSKDLVYSDRNYYFELAIDTNHNTTFKDGYTQIKFANYSLTCPIDPKFKCEDYGFNNFNTLREPKIIEVSGHRFLYSDVSYWCNGIGCGCVITFIYDLENKKPTFLENYRMPFDGFYLSDFDNDSNPDLLVISQTEGESMKGFNFEEFETRFSWYYYDKGFFKPKFNNRFQRFYCYDLYSITPFYHHSYHSGDQIYSVIKDNWME